MGARTVAFVQFTSSFLFCLRTFFFHFVYFLQFVWSLQLLVILITTILYINGLDVHKHSFDSNE